MLVRRSRTGRSSLDQFIASKCALARFGMVDDRLGVRLAEDDTGVFKSALGREPWRVNRFRRHPCQFGNPLPDIGAIRIEFYSLRHRVENPEVGCSVGAATGDPLPAGSIAGKVGIDERVPKPSFSFAPMDEEILDQKRGRDHAYAIVHPACMPKLPHACINNWKACLAFLPGTKPLWVITPRESIELSAQRLGRQLREMKQKVGREFPPYEFLQKCFETLALIAAARGPGFRRMPNGRRAEFPKVKVRGKTGRALMIGPVASNVIAGEGSIEKCL